MNLGADSESNCCNQSRKHKLQAKADASPSSELSVELLPNEITCIESKPNSEVFPAAFIIPLYANTVPSFIPTRVDCPSQEILAKMKPSKVHNNLLQPIAKVSAK